MRHASEQELVMGLLGEAEDRVRIEAHTAACSSCRERLEEIRRLLEATAETPIPEPDAGFESRIWERQRPRLVARLGAASRAAQESTVAHDAPFWSARRMALAGALAASLLLAFAAGLYTAPPGMEVVPRGSPASGDPDRVLLIAVGEHLASARMVLVELANADGTAGGSHQARAQQLLGDNRLYRQTAAITRQAALADVLDELERILLEVARSSSSGASQDLDWLRQRIEARDLLFRVSVIEGRACRATGSAAAEGI